MSGLVPWFLPRAAIHFLVKRITVVLAAFIKGIPGRKASDLKGVKAVFRPSCDDHGAARRLVKARELDTVLIHPYLTVKYASGLARLSLVPAHTIEPHHVLSKIRSCSPPPS
jgi:hypothetical protein